MMDDPTLRKAPLTVAELDAVLPLLCVHCGKPIERFQNGDYIHWAHKIGEGSYLNRCQSPDVRYGMEAHPRGVPCPAWCLGSRITEATS